MSRTTLSPAPLTACFPGSEVMWGGARGSLPGDGHESPRSRVARLPPVPARGCTEKAEPCLPDPGFPGDLSPPPRVNGACVPITMTANKTKRKFQYLLESKYRPAILQPHPPGPAPPPVRGRAWPGAQLPGRPPRDGVPGLGAAPPWHRQQWRARVGGGFREGPEAHTRSCPARGPASPQERVIRPCDGTRGIPGSGSCPPPTLTPGVTDAAQNRVFLGKADPKSYIILCNHREKREEVVAVSLLSKCPETPACPCPHMDHPPPARAEQAPPPAPSGTPSALRVPVPREDTGPQPARHRSDPGHLEAVWR